MDARAILLTFGMLVVLALSRALSRDYPRLRTLQPGVRAILTLTVGAVQSVLDAVLGGTTWSTAALGAMAVTGPALLDQLLELGLGRAPTGKQ